MLQTSQPRVTARGSTGHLEMMASPLSLRFKAKNMVKVPPRMRRCDVACRLLNVVVASLGILITAPLMVVIAVMIKLSSPGPIIYSQPRVGLDRRRFRGDEPVSHRRRSDHGGRVFTIYKFRTMRAEKPGAAQTWAGKNDPRITWIGHFLRATRLDELPQFFNVLFGDMNIVGPRPEMASNVPDMLATIPYYSLRTAVRPGVTGWAQIKSGYALTQEEVKEKLRYDLYYVKNMSLSLDLRILLDTVKTVLFSRGT